MLNQTWEKEEEQSLLEAAIRRSLTDLTRPMAVRLKAAIRILMTTDFNTFQSVTSKEVQEELADFIELLKKPESLAISTCKTEAGKKWVIDHIKQYTLDHLYLLDERIYILRNPEMVEKVVKTQEHLKAVVHTTAIRNVVTAAHFVDEITDRFKKQGLKGKELDYVVQRACNAMVELHDAVLNNDVIKVMNVLKVPGVDVNLPSVDGLSLLQIAVRDGDDKIVKVLLETPDINVNQTSNNGWTALHFAARLGRSEIAKALLNQPNIQVNVVNSDGWTSLAWAAWNGHLEVVEALLTHPNIKVNVYDRNKSTPLHWAARNGQADIIALFIAIPTIDLNAMDIERKTPLYFTAQFDHVSAAAMLLTAPKIDVNIQDIDGLTALHWAARNGRGDLIELLMANPNINTELRDHNQMRAKDWAYRNQFYDLLPLFASDSGSDEDDEFAGRRGIIPKIRRFLKRLGYKLKRLLGNY